MPSPMFMFSGLNVAHSVVVSWAHWYTAAVNSSNDVYWCAKLHRII